MSIRKRPSKKTKKGHVFEVYFPYKENGITKRYSKSGFLTKKEAQEHEALIKAEIKENGKIHKEVKKTLKEVYEEFLEVGAEQYQENTIYGTKSYYNKYINGSFGNVCVVNLDYPALQKYFNSLENQSLSTNDHIKAALNRILIYAIRAGYIKTNPLMYVIIKGKDTHRENNEETLSYESYLDIIDVLNSMNKFRYKAYAIAIQIGFYTGLRISEIFALEKNDIDFDNDLIYVNKKLVYNGLKKKEMYVSNRMKSKKSKAVLPLAEPLKQVLMNWFLINPYERIICDIDGYYLKPQNTNNEIKKAITDLNIDFHFHMLRHTYATTLVINDTDLKTTQELMRHSNINTTMSIYTHINNNHKKEILNNIFGTKSVEKVSKVIS